MIVQRTQADGTGAMFDHIAGRYDLLNRLMSLGMDGRWRKALVRALACGGDAKVLDVATGTGDVAMAIARAHPDARVVGLDPSAGMLAVAHRKITQKGHGLEARIALTVGDAQAMPFPDDRFDAACVSFGIRNVPDRARAIREMVRVVKPGGRVAVLELGEPRGGPMAPLARFHIRRVVPWLGARLSGGAEYSYLQRSIAAFPPPAEFAALLEASGLREVGVRSLAFGATQLFVGVVPGS